MKNCLLKNILLCTLFLLFSCENKKSKQEIKPYQAGVVLSFDDAYVNEWFDADKSLKKYDWKATFCVSKINTLDTIEINKLLKLQKEGHEIAGHGLHHYNAVKFISKYGINEYINQEINPMLAIMKKLSLNVTSFAYPDGERNATLDTTLLNKFQIVRGRAFGGESPSKQVCYFNNSRIVYGFDIDNSHIHFSIPYLLKLLDYAKKNNKILILVGHKTVKDVTANYQTKMKTLELICSYVHQNNMKFYTLSELNNLE
ncbi:MULTISPECIES: polysaccharide deacetylase family protein [unclassified Flavobacterium]|jgi:peptidoglycan/xylan/chitin deacetylase (PgdA/CDA1 family)|uniref:polysaccharide deacetylase family protein n=1 Tax=unclassified Flavobacterium TaxID=196869 RepID=UPI0025BEE8E7|nr:MULTISPECIES: polysaccharide deacetylase family protein [unclassified Flavobacterium]